MTGFGERLVAAVDAVGNPGCVGIDPHLDRLPSALLADLEGLEGEAWRVAAGEVVRRFGLGVVDAVAGVVPAVKPQSAFFEALGAPGVAALEVVVAAARDAGLVVVLDAKRGDIGSTARAYARATLHPDGPMRADAVTLSPYLGPESLDPFVHHARSDGRGLFVLLRTSNQGAGAWQNGGFASRVAEWVEGANGAIGGDPGPVGVVVGATLPRDEVRAWRERLPSAWFLVPGFGAQGAGVDDCRAHLRAGGHGALVAASRSVLFPASGDDGAAWVAGVRERARAFASAIASLR